MYISKDLIYMHLASYQSSPVEVQAGKSPTTNLRYRSSADSVELWDSPSSFQNVLYQKLGFVEREVGRVRK